MRQVSFLRFFFFLIICLFVFSACTGCTKKTNDVSRNSDSVNQTDTEKQPDPIQTLAAEIVGSMDDSLLAAQVLITGIDGRGSVPPHIQSLLEEIPAGAIMLFKYNLDTDNDSIRNLTSEASSLIYNGCGLAPFIAVDHEGGSVNRFLRGVASLPSASSYWELSLAEGKQAALEKIETGSFNAGTEIFNLGINMNFAPVAEFLNNDNRDFLLSRSYGPDPYFTAEAASAFVRAMEQAGVLCVIKHFPGSAGSDPHYNLSVLNYDRATLDNLIYPFSELIKNGARAIMIAHSAVPAIDDKIASLSSVVMQNWLRDDLGFGGLIISDDFSMAAAGGIKSEDAAILSVAAGADMVLVWQPDLMRTHQAFVSAIENGSLSRDRIREAVQRIIYEKIKMGLIDDNK